MFRTVLRPYVFSASHTARRARPKAEGARNAHAIRFKGSEPILAVPNGPFRANSGGGEFPRVNPGLCFLGHFGPRIGNVQTPSGRLSTTQAIAIRWMQKKFEIVVFDGADSFVG